MTVTTVDRPATSAAEMGIIEAKGITLAIKENFDSLGSMILQARDRKAYKALGYRSFETYCKTEFGKSISHAYQLIEDAKIVAELETEISKQSEKPITLNFPSSHLRPLKEIPGITDKLKIITYAQKLAKEEGKKPTKQHLEIAIFETSGKRSEDFRKAIQGLGFTKGVPVEVTKSLKQDRGFVTKVDKRGKIYVELYDGGVVSILCDADELRILKDTEKPANPGNDFIIKKGDKVKIFAQGLEGKIGELYTWKMGKHAIVLIDGASSPISIAYAQLELIPEIEPTGKDWETNLSWNNNGNTYYFDSVADTIVCDKWPSGLRLHPHHSELGVAEWMEKWENHHTAGLLESLINPSAFKKLALILAIKLPEDKKNEFITDLIAGLVRLLPSQFKLGATDNIPETEALQAENRRLQEQLAESESAIEAIVEMARQQMEILPEIEQAAPRDSTTKALSISFAKTIDELLEGKKTQTRRLWQEAYASSFIRYFEEGIAIPALNKGRHRGGHELGHIKLTQRPYQQLLSEMSEQDLLEEGGMVATAQEFIDGFFEGQDKSVWVLHFEFEKSLSSENLAEFLVENASEDLAPGDAAAPTEFPVEDAASTASPLGADESWFSVLDSNDFIQSNIELDGVPTETYRGWDIYVYDSSLADISHLSKGTFSTDFTWVREKEIIKPVEWLKSIINQVEDFCPGQLSLNLSLGTDQDAEFFPREIAIRVKAEKENLSHQIENPQPIKNFKGKTIRERRVNAEKHLERLKKSRANLDEFEKLRLGQTVWHSFNHGVTGIIAGFALTDGVIPHIFITWNHGVEGEPLLTSTEMMPGFLTSQPEL